MLLPLPTRKQGEPAPTRRPFWRLHPFDFPSGLATGGRFRIRYCNAEGEEVPPRAGLELPYVTIRLGGDAPPPPTAPPTLPLRERHEEVLLELEHTDRMQESTLKTGQIGARLSPLHDEKVQRALLTESAEREIATAGRVSSMVQQVSHGHLALVDAVNRLAERVGQPPPPPPPPLDWTGPLERLIGMGERLGVALIEKNPGALNRLLDQAPDKTRPAAAAQAEGGAAGAAAPTAAAPAGEPDVVEVPVPPPPGTRVYADFAAHLTPEERERLERAMSDPEQVAEWLRQIREREQTRGPGERRD